MIPVFKPSINQEEIIAVSKVLSSGWLGNGPNTKKFEEEFTSFIKAKYALAVNSASASLHLALIAAGVKKGDEVIVPSFTFVATVHPILMLGALPVFCDIDYETLCADPHDIERKITRKTRVIIVVHYGGHPADLDSIVKLAKKHNISLIEDCAHASGSYYKSKHVGTFGDFGCFSFAAIKNLTTGDGGMLVGKRKKDIDIVRAMAWSGISQSTWERSKEKFFKWRYNVISVGWKYQMNDIASALGLVQLKKLKENNAKRFAIAKRYNKELSGVSWIELPIIKPYAASSHHNYAIKVSKRIRDRLSEYLASNGIGTTVHYIPAHHYTLYAPFARKLSVTERVWKKILLLPIYPDLSATEQERIIKTLRSFNA